MPFLILCTLFCRSPSPIYMQNFLELLDKLLATEIPTENKPKAKERDNDEKEMKVLCAAEGQYLLTNINNLYNKALKSVLNPEFFNQINISHYIFVFCLSYIDSVNDIFDGFHEIELAILYK